MSDKYKDTLVLKQGDSVAMELPFNANPQPKVTWEFNKKPVSLSRRVTMDTIYNMTSLCLGHAVLADQGTYTARLENPYGKAVMDIKVVVKGKPTAPKNLRVTKVTENSVSLAWDTPEGDGGAPIKGYVIEKRDPHRMMYTHIASTQNNEYRVMRLSEGNDYVFQVSAENSVGVGEPAELAQGITAKSQFGEWILFFLFHIILFSLPNQ